MRSSYHHLAASTLCCIIITAIVTKTQAEGYSICANKADDSPFWFCILPNQCAAQQKRLGVKPGKPGGWFFICFCVFICLMWTSVHLHSQRMWRSTKGKLSGQRSRLSFKANSPRNEKLTTVCDLNYSTSQHNFQCA